MILKIQTYLDTCGAGSEINPFTQKKVMGGYIRLFQSLDQSTIDYDVNQYHDKANNYGPVDVVGISLPQFYHSDVIILKKILQFQGKKFVLIKNREIACVFEDLNFLIKALVEMDLERYSSFSPVDSIIDADSGQAVHLTVTDSGHVQANF